MLASLKRFVVGMPDPGLAVHGFFPVDGIRSGRSANGIVEHHQSVINHVGLAEFPGIWGRMCWSSQAGPYHRHALMALDPEELVTLTGHGNMKLHAAVLRAMTLPLKQRKRAMIVRDGEPAALKFDEIKDLATQWESRLLPIE